MVRSWVSMSRNSMTTQSIRNYVFDRLGATSRPQSRGVSGTQTIGKELGTAYRDSLTGEKGVDPAGFTVELPPMETEATKCWGWRSLIGEVKDLDLLGEPPVFELVAWISITGVPISLWDRHVFNRIGEQCGRLIHRSDASCASKNLTCNKLAILVDSGKRVSHEVQVFLEKSCD
ncbi:hypothetical protein Hanom_Chr08g00704161 [Helianthus anomalus]